MIVIFTERAVSVTMQNWRDVGAGARRAGDHQQRRDRLGHLVDAGVVEDVAAVAGLRMATPLAASMQEPPPSAMSTSAPLLAVDARTRFATSWSLGFGVTSFQTTGAQPGLAEEPQELVDPAGLDEPGSVTTSGRRAPSRAAAIPRLGQGPDPEDDLGGVELDQPDGTGLGGVRAEDGRWLMGRVQGRGRHHDPSRMEMTRRNGRSSSERPSRSEGTWRVEPAGRCGRIGRRNG